MMEMDRLNEDHVDGNDDDTDGLDEDWWEVTRSQRN